MSFILAFYKFTTLSFLLTIIGELSAHIHTYVQNNFKLSSFLLKTANIYMFTTSFIKTLFLIAPNWSKTALSYFASIKQIHSTGIKVLIGDIIITAVMACVLHFIIKLTPEQDDKHEKKADIMMIMMLPIFIFTMNLIFFGFSLLCVF